MNNKGLANQIIMVVIMGIVIGGIIIGFFVWSLLAPMFSSYTVQFGNLLKSSAEDTGNSAVINATDSSFNALSGVVVQFEWVSYTILILLFLFCIITTKSYSQSISYYPVSFDTTYVKATSTFSTYYAYNTFSPTANWSLGWLTQTETDQCLHVQLNTSRVITKVNYSNAGYLGSTTWGAKDFTMWGSNSASAFADTAYANDANWVQLTTSISTFPEDGIGSFTVTNTESYLYYRFKVANSYGINLQLSKLELQYYATY